MKGETRKPKYLRLYERLRREITGRQLGYGRKLPSKRTLAAEEGLSLITVEHALELLQKEGFIAPRERSGYFVTYRPGEWFEAGEERKTSEPRTSDGKTAAVSDGRAESRPEQPVLPFTVYARTVRKVLSDRQEAVLEKSPAEGLLSFREAIAAYLGRNRGLTVRPEQILVGSGAEYLYGLLVEALGADRKYGVEDPSYEQIRRIYEGKGVRVERLPLGKDGILSEALQESTADVLHVSPFRSYPSGVTASASKKQEYLNWLRGGSRGKDGSPVSGRILIEDDFESEFSLLRKSEDTIFGLAGGENVIYLNSFTKTVSSAVRTAYLVIPEDLIPLFREKIGHYSCPVPVLEQYVLAEIMENGDFERHLNRIRRQLRRSPLKK